MRAAFRAELLKQRTTRTAMGLLAAMVALVLLSEALHGFGFSASRLGSRTNQLRVMIEGGETLGSVFAGLLGALSMTAEIRHGTIRPTFLSIPQRGRVLVAKAFVSMVGGLAFGLIATSLAVGIATAVLDARGVTIAIGARDYALLIAGGPAAGALWGVIGLGIGAVVRNQVVAVVGIFVWLQIIENLLLDGAPAVSRFMPGALGEAIAGGRTGAFHTPALGALLLAFYAAAAVAGGWAAVTRSDVA